MNSTLNNTKATVTIPTKLSLLDIVIARHARKHGNHVSALVGCYLCLIGFPNEVRELRLAA